MLGLNGVSSFLMVRRFALLFLLVALVGGVVSGTPLHSSNDKMMKCCDKAKSGEQSPMAEATRLCCAVNCSDSTPTPSGSVFIFAPSSTTVSQSIADQIAALFPTDEVQLPKPLQYSRVVLTRTFQPRYIQHKAFLI
jgi:hypothetical protein